MCKYEYKGEWYTKEELTDIVAREQLVQQALKYKDNVKGLYKDVFPENPEHTLFEAAVQANNSEAEKSGALKVFGPEIVNIAQQLFPNNKVGDRFKSTLPPGEVYKAPIKDSAFTKRVTNYLQFNDIISKKKLGNDYFVKKTSQYDDPNSYKPEETERRNLEKISQLNKQIGYNAITVERKGNGYKITINEQVGLNFKLSDILNESTDENFKDDLVNRLYSIDTPVATDLLYNSIEMAKELNRPDLVNVGKFVYNFLDKNPTLEISIQDNFKDNPLLDPNEQTNMIGFYGSTQNRIYLSLDKLSRLSKEQNIEVIMEEFLHSVTIQPFGKKESLLNDAEKEYVDKLNNLFNYYKSRTNNLEDYRFTNVGEFIIGLVMEPDFQQHIRDIEQVQPENKGLLSRIFNWFFRAWSNLVGVKYDPVAAGEASADNTMDVIRKYLDSMDKVSSYEYLKQKAGPYDKVFPSIGRETLVEKRIGDSIELFRNNLDQMRRTGIMNKLNEQQKIALEGIRKDLNAVTSGDINKMALFTEFVNDLNNVIKTNLNQIKDIELSEKLDPDQKLASLHTIMATTKAFDLSIDNIGKMKRFLTDDTIGLQNTVDGILSNRSAINSIYNDVILPIVLDKYDNIFEYSVLSNNQSLDKELDFKNKKLEEAEKKGKTGLANVLRKEAADIVKKREELLPTRQRIEDLLTGKAKDSNFVSMYLEAWALSEDPTVSGLVDYIKQQFAKSAGSLQVMGNDFQNNINEFTKATGKTTNNPEKLHEDLIETVKQVDSYDGKDFKYKERLALVNQYNKDYIKDAQEFIYKLNSLQEKLRATRDQEHKDGIIDQLRGLRKEQRQWEKDYMERPYTDFYYKVFEILHEDLGGYTASESLKDIDDKLYQTEKAIRTTNDPNVLDDLFLQKDDILRERKRLYSVYNKPEGTKERKIADQLTKYKEESRKLADYKLTSKGLAKFNRDLEKLNDRFKSGQISDPEYKRWMDENTVQESFTDAFWKEYNKALSDLSDILERLGVAKDKNISELYAEVRNLANIYRSPDGIIEGEEVKTEEALHIKSLQEKINELKEKAEDVMGLTKAEKKRFYELSHISSDPYISDTEWAKYSEEFLALTNKKRKVSKSLMNEYTQAIKKLNELSESIPTENYREEYQNQLDKYAASLEHKDVPVRFNTDDDVYNKIGDKWFDSKGMEASNPDYLYRLSRAETSFDQSKWYKDNHIKTNKFIPSDTDGERGGQYMEVDDPIYIWKKMEPKDKGYIDRTPKAAFKYRERIVKDEFINKNYRDSVDGYNQPRIIGAKDNKYINSKYSALKASSDPVNKATLKYLNFLSDTHIENQKFLPQNQRIGYFLPSARKDWIESIQAGDYTAKSIYEKLGELMRRVKDEVKVNEQDKDTTFGYVSEDNNLLPVKMTGNIDIKDQSRDATRAIMMFAANNMDYKNLNESLPFINAVRDILSNPENNPLVSDTKGNIIKRTIRGKLFGVKKSGSNRARIIDEVYKTYYLGEKKKAEGAAKVIDTSLGYAAKMMLGLNPTSLISNFANAEIQKVLVTGMNGYFTAKQYGRAYQIFSSIIPDLIRDAAKVGNKSLHNQIVDHFGGINSEFRTHFAKDLKYTQLRNTAAAMFMPTSLAETEIANTVFIGIALNFKVKKGNDFVSLYDAYELDKSGNLKTKDGVTIDPDIEARFKRRLTSGLRKINGNYNSLDNTLAEKYVAGRMTFFMNKFYVPFFSNRWSGQRYDFETDNITQGYYRIFLQRFMSDIKNFNFNMVSNWSTLSAEQKSAYKRVGTEVLVSAICISLISFLGGQDPDDLKKNSVFTNNIIYQLNIIRSQNESFIPFPTLGLNEMINRIKNPFPLATKITNAGKLLQDSFLSAVYPLGLSDEKDVFYTSKTGWHEQGDTKVMADLDRLFGIFYRFKNIEHPEIAIRNFQNAQRIK